MVNHVVEDSNRITSGGIRRELILPSRRGAVTGRGLRLVSWASPGVRAAAAVWHGDAGKGATCCRKDRDR